MPGVPPIPRPEPQASQRASQAQTVNQQREARRQDILRQMEAVAPNGNPTEAISYLKIGEKFYSVNFMGEGLNIQREIQDFFNQKLEELKSLVTENVCNEVGTDIEQFYERLRRMSSRGQVSLAADKIGKPIWVDPNGENEQMLTRAFVWRPWQIKGYVSKFVECFGLSSETILSNFPTDRHTDIVRNNIPVEITFTQEHVILPGIVALRTRGGNTLRLIEPRSNCHTMSAGKLCIGAGDAKRYFETYSPQQLSQELSKINLYSLASSQYIARNGDTFSISEILSGGLLTNVSWRIVEEETTNGQRTTARSTGWQL